MLAQIATVASTLKSAGDIVNIIAGLRDRAKIQAKIIELQGVILTAQENAAAAKKEQLALLEEVGRLKEQIAKLEARRGEKESYQRTDMGGGTFAYTQKGGVKEGEADHAICANCYENGEHVSTLQPRGKHRGQTLMRCPQCKTTFAFGEREQPQPPQRPSLAQARRGFGRR